MATIEENGIIYAHIIAASDTVDGIRFVTNDDDSQQLAIMGRPAGHVIRPHVHEKKTRTITDLPETLFIRRGRVRLDILRPDGSLVSDCELGAGDVVLLLRGGHGLTILEDADIVEVKQGPYMGGTDKQFLD